MTSSARVGVLSVLAIAVATALVALGFTTGLLFAQTTQPVSPAPVSGAAFTHDQMHEMMDAMHGEGASDRMHEAMGADGEAMMDQCAAMMNMMGMMMNMMQGTQGMMGGMMAGPNGTSMSDMMNRMMGR